MYNIDKNIELGYACINQSLGGFRSYRKDSLKFHEHVKNIIITNWQKTLDIIKYNLKEGIYMYRLTSNIVPLETHKEFQKFQYKSNWKWYEDKEVLRIANEIKILKNKHNMRLSIHPGQYTVINTDKYDVLRKSVLDLYYHERIMKLIDGDDIIIHVGGVYGDKTKAISRWINIYQQLNPYLKSLIRLENDDKSYTLEDVVNISNKTGVAVCFDWHHNRCNNKYHRDRETYLDHLSQAITSWDSYEQTPKFHLSSGKDSPKHRSHSDWIKVEDFQDFIKDLTELKELKGIQIGKLYIMLECKEKNNALNRLREQLT